MFNREALKELKKWKESENRKPLILRGARQVGKTSLVKLFAKQFDIFINMNLEHREEEALFDKSSSVRELFDAICFIKNIQPKSNQTVLLLIDEIQNSSEAVKQLRYFYEDLPELFVIAAGSLLETLIDKQIHFPVGRVEFFPIRPVSFTEFLAAINEAQALQMIHQLSVPDYAHQKLYQLFNQYTFIGGMPEVVAFYAQKRQFTGLQNIYDSLLTSYLDDVAKYAKNSSQEHIIRHVIRSSFYEAGDRIKFTGFGKSSFKSREIGEALRILEKSMLLQLVYPVTSALLPLLPDKRKAPKLMMLDIGLVLHFAAIQTDILKSNMIQKGFEGKVNELVVGQELLSLMPSVRSQLHFWTRKKKTSNAEVDFVYPWNDMLVPLDVKSGESGRLRSLHLFMEQAPHKLAVRVYAGKFSVEEHISLEGKPYRLINIPFYLLSQLNDILKKHC